MPDSEGSNGRAEEKRAIAQGVNYQKALDNIAAATGYDYLSLNALDPSASAENADYAITAATGRFTGFSNSSELGLNGFLSTLNDAGTDADASDAIVSKVMKVKGTLYIVYGTKTFSINYEPDDAAIMLVPMHGILLRALAFTLVMLFLLVMGTLCGMLLRISPYKSDEAEIDSIYRRKKLDKTSAFIVKAAEKNDRLLRLNNDRLNMKITRDYFYSNVTPEREAFSTFELLMFIYTISIGVLVIIRNLSSDGGQTVLDYLFARNWTHGFNIFSLTAFFFLFCILFVILASVKAISAMLSRVLSKKSLTICSLIMNILFYAALIAFIFISLSCLGVNAKALLASAGIVGLAVSMGLRDVITDIMAGIVIITGRSFEVGDYIEIGEASSGTVKSMGLIKTELVSDTGKTFSIRNSQIKKVTNHSRLSESKTDSKQS